jgi:hypothetical protein
MPIEINLGIRFKIKLIQISVIIGPKIIRRYISKSPLLKDLNMILRKDI